MIQRKFEEFACARKAEVITIALFDMFKKKKDEFMDLPIGQQGVGYGPAGFPPQNYPQPMPGPGAGFPDLGLPSPPPEPMNQQFQQQMPMAPQIDLGILQRNIETMNYKMDSIKAALDAINSRLGNIETALRTTPGFETKQEGW